MTNDVRDKKLAYSLHGYRAATLRFEAAHWHRAEDAFVAVAEAVSWAVTLDTILEREDTGRGPAGYKDLRSGNEGGKTLIGMKFVRNHAQHAAELLDFIFVNAVLGNGRHGLRSFWMWAPLDELETVLDPAYISGKGLYRTKIGGRGVLDTLLDVNAFFSSLTPPLPDLPPDPSGVMRPQFQLPVRWPPVPDHRRL